MLPAFGLAKTLGLNEAANLLHETLAEEKNADPMLTGMPKKVSTKNPAANRLKHNFNLT